MSKLTDLTEVTTLADGDLAMAVDVSNTSMDATGTNSKVTLANIYAYIKTKTDTLYAAVLGADDNYVTDAEKVKLTNLSGTNSGDQTSIVGITGTMAQFDTAVSDGNIVYQSQALGTPASGTLTNCTGLPVNGIVDDTSSALGVGTLELGHASDTTISRVSAGVIAVEGVNVLTTVGGTLTGNLTLGENTSIDLDPAGSADGKYSGICITGTAGATLAFGDLIYLAVADSRWELTDSDATATSGTPLIGMCVLAAAADGNATKILLQGTIRADAKFPALTVGAPAYVGETAGAIQTAIPTGADNVIRVVGRALTADELYFCPSQDHQVTVA